MSDDAALKAFSDLIGVFRHRAAQELRGIAKIVDAPKEVQRPDAGLLDRLVRHVAYELVAMQQARLAWQRDPSWVAMEVALLHARLLADFYWPKKGAHDATAVWAEHYSARWISGGRPNLIGNNIKAIHRQLAHITRERDTDPRNLDRQVVPIVEAIWTATWTFIRSLDSDRADALRTALNERAAVVHMALPTEPAGG